MKIGRYMAIMSPPINMPRIDIIIGSMSELTTVVEKVESASNVITITYEAIGTAVSDTNTITLTASPNEGSIEWACDSAIIAL